MIPKGLWATFLGFFVSRVNHLKNQPLTKKQRQHWKLKLIGQFWMTQYLKIFVKPQGLQISTLEQVSMSSNACFVLRRPPSPGWLDDVRLIRLNLIWTGGVKHRGAMPLPPNSRRENFKMHFDGFNGWSEPTKNSSILFDCFRPSLWSMGRTHWKKWEKPLEPLQCALQCAHHPEHPSSDRCRAAKAPRKSIRFIEISRLCNDTPCTFGKLEMLSERQRTAVTVAENLKWGLFKRDFFGKKQNCDKDVTTKFGNWLHGVYIIDKLSVSYLYIYIYTFCMINNVMIQ